MDVIVKDVLTKKVKVKVSTISEAETIINKMKEYIERYRTVTIAELYSYCGYENVDSSSVMFGWDDISDIKIKSHKNGYKIKFPKAILLD